MDYPKEGSTSLYDYSDKRIRQAGYAAIVYAVISALSILVWFRAFPEPDTPSIANVIVAIVVGLFFGALAFGIFRKSRVAVVIMLVFVVGMQLYTLFAMGSGSGAILSIIVTLYLLLGARRIFQYHAKRKMYVFIFKQMSFVITRIGRGLPEGCFASGFLSQPSSAPLGIIEGNLIGERQRLA